ncbi:MAG: 23S rRNA (guanosine(2251)-2'-O)-methyltransferase RlmB [Porphyromonas sp.]|nr:23S rRNA (guanosine(2251)-2'-O)-methyltransferase RlmB [Porphyromonas sp.]
MKQNEMIFGIRAVLEAIDTGVEIDHIYLKRETDSEMMKQLLEVIGKRRIPIRKVPSAKLNRLTRKNHQGIIAIKAATAYHQLDQLIPTLYEEGREPFIVVLDGITDVHNFGAIARTCECAGVDAIVIFEQNSVSVTADAIKTSSGALFRIPVCRESSLPATLDYLQQSGLKLIGATEKSDELMYDAPLTGSLAVIMGSEGKGLSEQTLKRADHLVRIPMYGDIGSLNVSVATGILIYEIVRQKNI